MNATTQNQRYALQELEKEALMGAEGEETFAREVRCIDLSNFAARKNDIAEQLGGSGLGLSIAQAICHAHGGTIEASLPSGGGLRMRIVLQATA